MFCLCVGDLAILFQYFGCLNANVLILWIAWMGCSKVIELETDWRHHNRSLVPFSTVTCFGYIWSQFLHSFLASQIHLTEMTYWTRTTPGDDFLELVSCILVCQSHVLLGNRWSPLIHVASCSSWENRGWNQLQSCFLVLVVVRVFSKHCFDRPKSPLSTPKTAKTANYGCVSCVFSYVLIASCGNGIQVFPFFAISCN